MLKGSVEKIKASLASLIIILPWDQGSKVWLGIIFRDKACQCDIVGLFHSFTKRLYGKNCSRSARIT